MIDQQITRKFSSKQQIFLNIILFVLVFICVNLFFNNKSLNNKLKNVQEIVVLETSYNNKENSLNKSAIEAKLTEIENRFTEINKTLSKIQVPTLALIDKINQVIEIKPAESKNNPITTLAPTKSVKIFELYTPLQPDEVYSPIVCRKSAEFRVKTTLCVHNLNNDIHVSGSIMRDGVWEPKLLSNIIKQFYFLLKSKR
jgi:hypothetical protein